MNGSKQRSYDWQNARAAKWGVGMGDLPNGWMLTTLKEVVEPYESIDPRGQPERCFRYVDIGSIDNRIQKINDPKEFFGQDAPSRARRVIKTGDVLFSTVRTYLKNIALVTEALDDELTTTGIVPLRPNEAITSSYLFNWVCSDHFITSISKSQSGTLYPAVSEKDVLASVVAVPPLGEQRRIVAKLNNLISRTANARAALFRIPALIEKYKQVILHKAFSGDLTAGWRNKHGVSISDTVRLGDVVSDIRYGTAKKSYPEKHGTAVLRIPNVSGGHINLSDLKYSNFEDAEMTNLALQIGDILVVRSNGSPDLVGRVALVTEAEAGLAYAGYLIRLRPNFEKINPQYLKFILESPQIRKTVKSIIRSSNGIHNINSGELSRLELPCPEFDEQIEIVRRIETDFVWLDRVSNEHIAASEMLSALDPSILQVAFQGELVPQNPRDEPASVMLERINAEREAVQAKTKSGRKTVAPPKRPEERVVRMANLIEVLKSKTDWVPATNAAQALGIGDGATSDALEVFYNELRMHLQNGHIEVERRGNEDWLRLMPISEE